MRIRTYGPPGHGRTYDPNNPDHMAEMNARQAAAAATEAAMQKSIDAARMSGAYLHAEAAELHERAALLYDALSAPVMAAEHRQAVVLERSYVAAITQAEIEP